MFDEISISLMLSLIIIKAPISQLGCRDRLVWHFEKKKKDTKFAGIQFRIVTFKFSQIEDKLNPNCPTLRST